MSARNIMRALSPGETASTEEDVTVAFLGREWHVQAYIGTPHNGGAMVIGEKEREVDPEKLARTFIKAACVCMCAGGDPAALEKLAVMLAHLYGEVAANMAHHKANRGKPS